ncbi:MAG: peroxiredoxin [Candidatus Methanoplasma sp.]|jgi:peroxiredoxin (alkyl hydroperoxide reductase subunit C)|nr:peroxiredoxin [Candidatus Methanoplasma sp.]
MTENETTLKMPLIGDKSPEFKATTTQGVINFPQDFKGKWIVFFSHPADFTPVCTTEFMTFAHRAKELADINTVLVGLSVDSLSSHIAWLRKIKELKWKDMEGVDVEFPLIEDISMTIANKFGMIMPGQSNTQAVRAVFVIDPEGTIRLILYYPLNIGWNFDEIKRVVMALQQADGGKCATPMDWKPGEDTVIPAPRSMDQAKERAKMEGDKRCYVDWFLCFNKGS